MLYIHIKNMSSKRFGSIRTVSLNTSELSINKTNATQGTNVTTAVSCEGNSGIINTVSSTLAAGSSASFTVDNPRVAASSVVLTNIVGYTGNAGCPLVRVNSVTSGSYSVTLTNMFDASTSGSALNGVVRIGYIVM